MWEKQLLGLEIVITVTGWIYEVKLLIVWSTLSWLHIKDIAIDFDTFEFLELTL